MAHEEAGFRLPRDVVPRAYAIDLTATPRRKAFDGIVSIRVELRAPQDAIVLHARGLSLREVVARVGRKRHVARVRYQRDRETASLHFDAALPAGEVELEIAFAGKLDPRMHGLYLARSGPEVAIASQCEAADARAIFPCFDEPDRKATFEWTVRTDPGLLVITNGVPRSVRTDRASGLAVHRFEPTPVLPTYLVAVAIGRFEATDPRVVRGVPCRVVVPEGKLAQAAFAEEAAAAVLSWFTDWFGQRYHYGKIDQVAIPGFDAGAMENAGAIFYRQQLLLLDDATTSWHGRKQIAETIAHEIAHQWFGNRVTMCWWDDLWLNEAFATWISHKAVDAWHPAWRIWDDFQVMRRSALGLDALESTHPIYAPVASPAQATEMFDAITYYKGCCVLRQLEGWLGEEPFRAGLRAYMKRFRDRNAAGADLWRAIGEAAGTDVDTVARSWTEQAGFPLVRIEAREQGGATVLRVRQRRFFARPGAGEADETLWALPLQIRWSDGTRTHVQRALVREREAEIELPGRAAWVHGNADAVGFYRVELDDASLERVAAAAAQLTPAERQSLLDDLWALVMAARTPIDRFLDLLAAFAGETDYAVLEAMASRAGTLLYRIADPDAEAPLRAFFRGLFGPSLDSLGWDPAADEPPERAVARAQAVGALGELGRDAQVLDRAEALAAEERADAGSVDANLAGAVVRLSAIRADKRRLAALVTEYLARRARGAPPEEQARYLRAFGAVEAPSALREVQQLSLGETVPQEQIVSVLRSLFARPAGALATWKFFRGNWEAIAGRTGPMGISHLVESLGRLPRTSRREVERFFAQHPVEEARRALRQALEEIDLYADLRDREAPRLAAWLQRRGA